MDKVDSDDDAFVESVVALPISACVGAFENKRGDADRYRTTTLPTFDMIRHRPDGTNVVIAIGVDCRALADFADVEEEQTMLATVVTKTPNRLRLLRLQWPSHIRSEDKIRDGTNSDTEYGVCSSNS